MTESLTRRLSSLRRPALILRAARIGVSEYRRERDLKRLLKAQSAPGPREALSALLHEEEKLETTRREGDCSYSVAAHVDLLIALLAEARLATALRA
ncbi:DUF6477 family protein [Falsigemmobacter faecalis]|uniref:Uncharacterized protein n=1 Tax=Falsigemmobacter faecalis TaxID=2488730 RepID=A0A3P3DUQ7_9RHOB|nr:DUF6477 family protein [Falsigemmobacter faecalis]RRH76438.1 hypothetical protein EG244_06700 [Falsigemmobacter faecalis]